MKIYLRAPKDWQAADRHRILGEKVLREDRRPVEIEVIRFDKYGRRINPHNSTCPAWRREYE
jgi:hypothetical protein